MEAVFVAIGTHWHEFARIVAGESTLLNPFEKVSGDLSHICPPPFGEGLSEVAPRNTRGP
ncbi:MAG: hypothetical protein AABP62_26235 [Planctomycetota bacterium]